MWSFDYPPHNQSWTDLIGQFTKANPQYQIKLEPQANEDVKMMAGVASGTAGDILSVHGHSAQRFILANALAQLDPAVLTFGAAQSRYFDGVLSPYISKGKLYGIPLANNTPGIGMILSVDAFNEAQIDVPSKFNSWEEVWETAKKLTKKDSSGKITRSGICVREGHQLQYICGFMLEQGKEYFDEPNGRFFFESPEGQNSFKSILYDPVHTRGVDSLDIPEAFNSLVKGQAAMGMIWIDYIPLARSQYPDKKFSFAVRPPYKGDKVIVVGEGGWGANVYAKSKNLDGGYAFMKFLDQDDTQLLWDKQQNAMPALQKLIDDPWFKQPENDFMKEALKTLADSRFMGPVGDLSKLEFNIAWPAMVDILQGKQSVQAGMTKIDTDGMKQYQDFIAQAGKA